MSGVLPSRFMIACGTYDGTVAGWDSDKNPKLAYKPSSKSNLSPTR